MSDELETERAKPPPVDHTAELEALHTQVSELSAQLSAHGAQIATLQLELEVAHAATAAAAAATAQEAAAHEATRETIRTLEDAHAAAMAALEQRYLADLAVLKEVHATELAKLKGYLAARQVAQIALCHTLDDADDELKEERRYRENCRSPRLFHCHAAARRRRSSPPKRRPHCPLQCHLVHRSPLRSCRGTARGTALFGWTRSTMAAPSCFCSNWPSLLR